MKRLALLALAIVVLSVSALLHACMPKQTDSDPIVQYPSYGDQRTGATIVTDGLISIGIESDPNSEMMATTEGATTINTRWQIKETADEIITSPASVKISLKLDGSDFAVSLAPGESSVIPNHKEYQVIGIEMIGWTCVPRDEMKQLWDCTQQ